MFADLNIEETKYKYIKSSFVSHTSCSECNIHWIPFSAWLIMFVLIFTVRITKHFIPNSDKIPMSKKMDNRNKKFIKLIVRLIDFKSQALFIFDPEISFSPLETLHFFQLKRVRPSLLSRKQGRAFIVIVKSWDDNFLKSLKSLKS